ncbi:MAG: hypothetical protein M0Q94_14165 [Candidatus Cloacimonetes bacterium]|nr:hypothetical protein [Candidatus Cloacimonadota bacterium]
MKIILISGKARNGKSETAKILKNKLETKGNKVLTTAFGNLVKFVCEKFFNSDGQKNEYNRSLWQRIGTDVIRKQKPNYWVDFIISIISMFPNEWNYVIIDDCRFVNELNRYDETWDTTTVRVNRLNFESNLTPEQKNHPCETALDNYNFDYVINSESGLDNLEKEVDKFLKWMEEMDETD